MFAKVRSKLDSNENSLLETDANLSEMLLLKEIKNFKSLGAIDDIAKFLEKTSKEELFSLLVHKLKEAQKHELELEDCIEISNENGSESESESLAFIHPLKGDEKSNYGDTWRFDKDQSDDLIHQLQESEQELIGVVDKLQQKNVLLHTRIEDLEAERVEFDKLKIEFYKKQDNIEEVCNLQRQELAKIQHMLVISEKDVKKLQLELNENITCLMKSRERNDEAESLLVETAKKKETIERAFDDLTFKNKKLANKLKETEGLYKILLSENSDLKDKLSYLNGDLRKVRRSLSNAENNQRNVSDKYEYLKHSSETVLNKAQTDLEEKDNVINRLESKLKLTEERIDAEKLTRDEQIKDLTLQKETLEKRLNESHQQLNNIKLNWSDTINQLENQVSHLNSKIAEDNDKISEKSKETNYLKKTSKEKIDSLTNDLNLIKIENNQLLSEKNTLTTKLEEIQTQLNDQASLFKAKLEKSTKAQLELEKRSFTIQKFLKANIEELSLKLRESDEILQSLKSKVADKCED